MMAERDRLTRAATVAEVRSGMRLGLGTGGTVGFALQELARRIRKEVLWVAGIPTSRRAEAAAQRLGIPLMDFSETDALDLAIDGADELLPGPLTLIKGHGGALLRERIVAAIARRFLAILDSFKIADRFGGCAPVPVEVVPFCRNSERRSSAMLKIERAGCARNVATLPRGRRHNVVLCSCCRCCIRLPAVRVRHWRDLQSPRRRAHPMRHWLTPVRVEGGWLWSTSAWPAYAFVDTDRLLASVRAGRGQDSQRERR
jgi:ribose 5-phosphate isomerase